jgi:hypothetical protein
MCSSAATVPVVDWCFDFCRIPNSSLENQGLLAAAADVQLVATPMYDAAQQLSSTVDAQAKSSCWSHVTSAQGCAEELLGLLVKVKFSELHPLLVHEIRESP